MKGLFIPEVTAEMFRNGCLESIEALMAEGEIYDIDYSRGIPVSERLPEEGQQVLNKIRDEIMELQTYKMFEGENTIYSERDDVLAIIDKYKTGEGEE